jgi:CHAT domain-containing protein
LTASPEALTVIIPKVLSLQLMVYRSSILVLALLLSALPALAQEAAPKEVDKPASASGMDAIQKATVDLHAAEAAHPGNTVEVCAALSTLVGFVLDAHTANEETLALAKREMTSAEAGPGPHSSSYVQGLADYAQVLVAVGRAAEGRPYIEKSYDLAATYSPEGQDFADAADVLGFVCTALGDYPCALKGYRTSLAMERKLKGADPFDIVGTLSNMATTLGYMEDHAGAIAALKEALDLAYAKAPNDPHMLVIENNIGAEYSKTGDFNNAIPHLTKGIELARKEFGDNSHMVQELQQNLAATYGRMGKFDLSWKLWSDSIQQLKVSDFDSAHAHSNYGRSLASGGDLKPAVAEGLTGARLARESFVLAMRTLPERQALLLDRRRAHGLDLSISVVARHPDMLTDDVYQEVIRSRAMVADEMARRQKNLNRNSDPEVAALLKNLDQARTALQELEQKKGAAPDAVSAATDKMERAERALAERSAAFRDDERIESVALEDVRHNLPPGSLLISYVRFGRSVVEAVDPTSTKVPGYAVFVFHPDTGKLRIYDLGVAAPIDALVDKARSSVDQETHSGGLGGKRNERAYRDAAGELRSKVWDPLRAEFAGAKLLLVVPDGKLNMVPFAAFPDGDGYWLDHGQVIHMMSSERDLVPVEHTERKSGLLAIGNPTFNTTQAAAAQPAGTITTRSAQFTCDDFQRAEFHALPESAREVKDISAQWSAANSGGVAEQLLGSEATRESFLREAVRGRVLHVATHAFLLSKSCGDGNPLLQSGLVFAGANSSRESSLLTAQQIASLDLDGVDWAVLSACNTGGGDLRDGEGVLGLQRAFRIAGTRSVIMTLWPVDDTMSRHYMHELYAERFGRHATTADAVWNASRKLLADRRAAGLSTHPWYWAGFVGSGAWE